MCLALNAALLTGCVGIVPVPPRSSEVLEGRKLVRSDVRFIVPGVTTRIDVLRHLGSASRICHRPPAITYFWKTPGWRAYWWAFAPYSGEANEFPFGERHAFFVAFDDRDVVLQSAFVSPWRRGSLDEQLEQWATSVRSKTRK